MTKKILSIILCICILFSLCVSYVQAKPLMSTQTIESNEYDIYLQYIGMSDGELADLGKTKEEIELIRNFSYEDEIRKRAKLSDQVLETYGYTKK